MKKIPTLFLKISIFLSCASLSCKKLVEVKAPYTSVTAEAVYSDDISATGVVTALYAGIASSIPTSNDQIQSIPVLAALSADELKVLPGHPSIVWQSQLKNNIEALTTSSPWNTLFATINASTYVIEGLGAQKTKDIDPTSNLTSVTKNQLIGESKFLRAFCYYYLTAMYGDVPLVLNKNLAENSQLPRSPVKAVYQQIIKDLSEAKETLNKNFLDGTLKTSNERVRPTYWAAAALLSRVYLCDSQFSKAVDEASIVIGNSELFSLTMLNDAFLKNSKEAIWQIQPVNSGWNTGWGRFFVLTTAPATTTGTNDKPFYLNEDLVADFEPNDPRKANWIGTVSSGGTTYYFADKYRKGAATDPAITSAAAMTEYMMMLRLSEQYLIRAEARLTNGDRNGALQDINAVRLRARNGNATVLPDIQLTSSDSDILKAIDHERRVELFLEWGDRWFNLKRRKTINEVMAISTPKKGGGDWLPHQALYPISPGDINKNPALVQNAGY